MSETTSPYGLRFFNEFRRLTASTWGVKYSEIPQLQAMGQDEVVAFVSKRVSWASQLDATSPERFARAIVREFQAREDRQDGIALAALLLVPPLPWPFD